MAKKSGLAATLDWIAFIGGGIGGFALGGSLVGQSQEPSLTVIVAIVCGLVLGFLCQGVVSSIVKSVKEANSNEELKKLKEDQKKRAYEEYPPEIAEGIVDGRIDELLAIYFGNGELTEEELIVASSWDSNGPVGFSGVHTLRESLRHDVFDLATCQMIYNGEFQFTKGLPLNVCKVVAHCLGWRDPEREEEKVLKTKTKHILTWYTTQNNRKVVRAKLTFDNDELVQWELNA